MSVLLTVTAATQLCAGCTVEFEPTNTLGAAEDPAGVGVLADVLDMGPQGYLVSSEVLGGVVIVYDSEGRYQRELTREGDGPGELRGEPRFAMGAGQGKCNLRASRGFCPPLDQGQCLSSRTRSKAPPARRCARTRRATILLQPCVLTPNCLRDRW